MVTVTGFRIVNADGSSIFAARYGYKRPLSRHPDRPRTATPIRPLFA
jgi:hypothetical protein